MEIDVSHLMARREGLADYSASQAELGPNAWQITWDNAMRYMEDNSNYLVSPAQSGEARKWFADLGAWSREEIDGWTMQELNALILQFVAGDIRETGENSGRLYGADGSGWFFYIGN